MAFARFYCWVRGFRALLAISAGPRALPGRGRHKGIAAHRGWPPCSWYLAGIALSASCLAGLADEAGEQALRSYQQAQSRLAKKAGDLKAGWEFGRACFDLAEFATNNAQRAELAGQGISACRQVLAQDAKSAPAHYYLGLNLGQLARTRGLSAFRIIKEMESAWTTAAELDGTFDHAGPERSLGMLYRDAPSIASIGSRAKARQQLTRAVELEPHYPENRLELIDTYLKWGDRAAARRELKALEDLWPVARGELTGPNWSSSWTDWEAHLDKVRKKLEDPSKLESPRH